MKDSQLQTAKGRSSKGAPRATHAQADDSRHSLDVAVIIVTYNSQGEISKCLSSLYREFAEASAEVIVVDNGSEDQTVSIVREQFPQVRLLDTGENLGFARACNLAAKQSQAPYFLQLNPDTVVLQNAVDKILAFARDNPKNGFYGGRTLKEDGKTLEPSSCWGLPSLWSLFMFASGLSTVFRRNGFFDPESLGSWDRDSIRKVGVITGCFLLAERSAWERLGGFDEHYWLYGEDADLSFRAKEAGYQPVIYPEAITIHEIGRSSTASQKTIWLHQGKVSYLKRNWRQPARSLGLLLLKIGILLRYCAYSMLGKKDNQWVACWMRRKEWASGHVRGRET